MSVKNRKLKRDNAPEEVKDVPPEYIPIMCELTKTEKTFNYNSSVQLSENMDTPLFSLGFHHFIHAGKDKMNITEQFENKKKVYFVMHTFDTLIEEYDANIENISVEYFRLNNNSLIVSRAFYKLWEMLFIFDLIPTTIPNFVSLHIAESPGGFVQATSLYRDTFCEKHSKNDKYYVLTLDSRLTDETKDSTILEMSDIFINNMEKEKPKRLNIHKTHPKSEAENNKNKDNGDVTQLKTLKNFENSTKDKAMLITADGGFNWKNENTQEQEMFPLIIGQILLALKMQQKGGNFVCKFYETFTKTSCKLIYSLMMVYDNVYCAKPLLSHASNSERYIICKGFNDTKATKLINELVSTIEKMNESPKLNIIDIFPELVLPETFLTTMTWLNSTVSNKQLISINKIVAFIKSQNYYGEEFQQNRLIQIEASKYWINTFYPNKNEFQKTREKMEKLNKMIVEQSNKKILELQI